MIQLKNVTKIYGSGKNSVIALENVNINFGSKGLVVILGKSGCGKSTLLNIMGGLDKTTTGELVVNGRSAKTFSSSEFDSYRNTYVGMVFQEFNLIDEITVYQNIEITLKLQRRNTDVNTVDEVLSMVGLSSLGYRRPSELSGGQRQRVALARALLKNPQILLADEPTGSLDVSTSEEVFEVLKKLARNQLVVVVTHDRELAFAYGERIIELIDGRVVLDKEIQPESYTPVKSFSKNVIEVSAGGKISPQDINDKLKKNSHNYVGISHDKDRIALAYPETFDFFYLPKEKLKMRDTLSENIESDGKPFNLQKGALTLKDAISMARVNKKRTRKRFRFITFLNTLCFALLSLSFILSMVNLPDVIAKSAFDTYSQSLVAVSPMNTGNYWDLPQEMTETDITTVSGIAENRKLHKVYSVNLFPYYAISETVQDIGSIAGSYMSATNNIDITLNSYTGVIEGSSLSDLGIPLVENGGLDSCRDFNDIIISDFAADKLLKRGFFGLDKNGLHGCYYPKQFEELVGMSVKMVNADLTLKIAGIFKTDYLRYKYLIKTEERVSQDSQISITNWQNNKNFLYSKIFTKSGFINEHFDTSATQIDMGFYGEQFINFKIDINTVKYEHNYFKNPIDTDNNSFLWIDPMYQTTVIMPSGEEQPFPNLNENGIAVSLQLLQAIFPRFNPLMDIKIEEGIVELNPQYRNLEIQTNNEHFGVPIAAVYDAMNFQSPPKPLVVGTYLINQLRNNSQQTKTFSLRSVMFYRGGDFGNIKTIAGKLIEKEYLMYCSVGSISEILQLGDMFGTAAEVFFYISLAVAAFSFLLILNYMSSSIRFRAKEIAVYRVIGARRIDVAKIFLTESMMLAIISTFFASILGAIITYFVKTSAKSMLQIFNLSFSIFSFDLLTVALIFVSASVLVVTASLLPIFAITRRKAIEALKIIG